MRQSKNLVSVSWLVNHLNDENLVILYTTLVAKKTTVPEGLQHQQIEGARLFDLKQIFSDQDSSLPNTYPSVQQFEEGCKKLGINNESKIVVYDLLGIYSSPRVWFLFKSMGHNSVYVLDGGLQEWMRQGNTTVPKERVADLKGNFKASLKPEFVASMKEVEENLETKEAHVIDARSAKRFNGEVSEERGGLRSGSIPDSSNMHYASLLEDGKFKSEEEIRELFSNTIQEDEPVIFSCGSGITACILYLAADSLITNELKVYDGSWTEWGAVRK